MCCLVKIGRQEGRDHPAQYRQIDRLALQYPLDVVTVRFPRDYDDRSAIDASADDLTDISIDTDAL
jgi:hypothetical protein